MITNEILRLYSTLGRYTGEFTFNRIGNLLYRSDKEISLDIAYVAPDNRFDSIPGFIRLP